MRPLISFCFVLTACGVAEMKTTTPAEQRHTQSLPFGELSELDAGQPPRDAGSPGDCAPGELTTCTTSCGSTGNRSCNGGDWGATCVPPAEICGNGVDDDCNGLVDLADESCRSCTPGQTRGCTTSCGSTGTQSCDGNGQWPSYCPPPGEVCGNGVDDDCNGLTDLADETCWSCTPGQTRGCTTSCGSTGTQSCDGNGQWPSYCPPPPEVCGNGIDDDCNGNTDLADQTCWSCTPGQHRACTTSCGSTGDQTCDGNGQWPSYCPPPPENCSNGVDDDCDGRIDDTDFDCPGPHHDCTDTEGNACNGDWGYGDECDPSFNTGGCSDARFWAWCNRRNPAYPNIWDSWIENWVTSRCDGVTTQSGAQYNEFSCTDSNNVRWTCTTPLVLVFDGARVQYRRGGTFGFAPGVPVESDWPEARTPWLVRDLNGNGEIDDGRELFGSETVLPDGSKAQNGFHALAALDANHDGAIDSRDPAFSQLRLWSDLDGDRHVQPGELRTLGEWGVTRLRLDFSIDPKCDARGNCESERAAFGWTDAAGRSRVGSIVDVWLQTRPAKLATK